MQNQIQYPEYLELVSKVEGKEIGQVLHHDEIAEIMMVKKGTCRYFAQIKKANKELLAQNRQLLSVRGDGYAIIGADGMVDLAVKMMERSKNRSKKAMDILENIDKTNLVSDEAVEKYNFITLEISRLYASLSGGLVSVRRIQKNNKKELIAM